MTTQSVRCAISVAIILSLVATAESASAQVLRVRPDLRLFSVFAFLNAAGYNTEYGHAMDTIRILVRKSLDDLDPILLNEMNTFYKSHQDVDWIAYRVYSLMLSNPPDFHLAPKYVGDEYARQLNRELAGFSTLLSEFYREACIDSLYSQLLPTYEKGIDTVRKQIGGEVDTMWNYLRITRKNRPKRKIVVIPNLLNSYYLFTQFDDSASNVLHIFCGPPSSNSPIVGGGSA